jgi:transposase
LAKQQEAKAMAKKKQTTFERLSNGKLNRKQRKELARRLQAADPGLEVVHRNAAGIDVGNASHFVAVAPGCDPEPVREFGSWTADLLRMADWLKQCGVKTVAMQSTGVYWIALHEVLEKAGIQVWLVNARETKNLPGRKSDVQESQWLLKLHTYGLLRNSFRPPEQICQVRTIWRLRDRHVQDAGREIQHMQKALTTMNVQLANAISDVSGYSGQAIIRAILKGERDPYQLAQLKDYRVRASQEEVARSLEGHWQEEVLFELQQAVDRYDFCQRQIGECDERLQRLLAAAPSRTIEAVARAEGENKGTEEKGASGRENQGKGKKQRSGKPRKNEPKFELRGELSRIFGVDLTTLDGVHVMTAQTIYSEVGADLSAFPTEGQFVSWLKLAPNRQISGGKVIRQERSQTTNPLTEKLRMAASTLANSDSYLGARFRSIRARRGPAIAVKAMAAHLARLVYRMLKHGQAWVDKGAELHEKRRIEREKKYLRKKAAALGCALVEATV